jgi:hypothetical protein
MAIPSGKRRFNSADIEDKDKIQAVGKRQSSDDESSASGKVNVEEFPFYRRQRLGLFDFIRGSFLPYFLLLVVSSQPAVNMVSKQFKNLERCRDAS